MRQMSGEIARRSVPAIVRLATAGVLDINPILQEAGQVLTSVIKDRLSAHLAMQKSLQTFRATLEDLASKLSEAHNDLPLVVIIDELDRCRPSYATELLEIAKHLFVVNNTVFVIAVNRVELAHSISALYGNSFDALGYLRRFIDIDFRLPEPERAHYIRATLDSVGFDSYFERTQDRDAIANSLQIRNMISSFFDTSQLSVRTIAQALHRLGLLYASLRSDRRMFGLAAVVALIIRTVDIGLYHKMIQGQVTDANVADAIFSQIGKEKLRGEHIASLFEGVVIHGVREISNELYGKASGIETPLLDRYTKIKEEQQGTGRPSSELIHAHDVVSIAEAFASSFPYDKSLGFLYAVRRLELLSGDLIEEDT